jgi:hypothetical protein
MAQPALNPAPCPDAAPRRGTEALERAVARTLAYFSLFSYVPSLWETHRYLHGMRATPEQVRRVTRRRVLGAVPEILSETPRQDFAGKAGDWGERRAPRYARLLGYLPYVRMIGLTGSRAMNGTSADDIDLMVVSAPGRVWLCRLAMVVAVRLAGLRGDTLCPNYVVSAACLALPEMTIYDAHELAQMIPLYGGETYRALWARNPAVSDYLPNADPFPDPADRPIPILDLIKRSSERVLAGRLGDHLERWERKRKVTRLRRQGVASTEISLTADQCKGHFDGHRARVLDAYDRLRAEFEGV